MTTYIVGPNGLLRVLSPVDEACPEYIEWAAREGESLAAGLPPALEVVSEPWTEEELHELCRLFGWSFPPKKGQASIPPA